MELKAVDGGVAVGVDPVLLLPYVRLFLFGVEGAVGARHLVSL